MIKNGLPADRGFRPRLKVACTADQVRSMCAPSEDHPLLDVETTPIDLDGFGPIGPKLAQYLLCVGDTKRPATERQGVGIEHRQNGRCGNTGCHHPIGHIHHVVWWSRITGTYREGFTFTNARGTALPRAA